MSIVVIGAGVVGLSAGYAAIRQGFRVTIVDADHRGRATDAGAGIVNPLDLVGEQSAAEQQRVALAGPTHYRDLIADLAEDGETDQGYATVGQVVVAMDDAENAVLERLAARLSRVDQVGPVSRLTAGEARGMVPYLGDCAGALLLPGIARVDGRKLSACLAGALRKRGAEFRTGVGAVVTKDDAVVGVEIDGERVETERVVVATGAWWPGTAPVRGQIVHLSYRDRLGRTPVLSNIGGPYILAFDPDRIVTGATHEEVGFDYRVTAGGVAEVLEAALRVAPGLGGATLVETRVGFRPVSRDRLPLLGPIPGQRGAVLATGLGAHGLTLGPAVGAIAARLAMGQDSGHDIAALRPDRFN